jgi:hypothetical protein
MILDYLTQGRLLTMHMLALLAMVERYQVIRLTNIFFNFS